MFQFPKFASLAGCIGFTYTGSPIRISTDLFVFANPRSFSQLITSFFASESLGIHRLPFFASFFLSLLYLYNNFLVCSVFFSFCPICQ